VEGGRLHHSRTHAHDIASSFSLALTLKRGLLVFSKSQQTFHVDFLFRIFITQFCNKSSKHIPVKAQQLCIPYIWEGSLL
jgi:hypothetical protein